MMRRVKRYKMHFQLVFILFADAADWYHDDEADPF